MLRWPQPSTTPGVLSKAAFLPPSLPPATADGKLLLASASQDKNVRVWAVQQQQHQQQQRDPQQQTQQQQQQPHQTGTSGSSSSSSAEAQPLDLSSLAQSLTRYAPKPLIRAQQHEYSATLEALLIGHEDWVHSVAWQPPVQQQQPGSSGGGGGSASQPACLLTASMDRTMMVWRPDQATGRSACAGFLMAHACLLGCLIGLLGPSNVQLPPLAGASPGTVPRRAALRPALPPRLRCSKQRAHLPIAHAVKNSATATPQCAAVPVCGRPCSPQALPRWLHAHPATHLPSLHPPPPSSHLLCSARCTLHLSSPSALCTVPPPCRPLPAAAFQACGWQRSRLGMRGPTTWDITLECSALAAAASQPMASAERCTSGGATARVAAAAGCRSTRWAATLGQVGGERACRWYWQIRKLALLSSPSALAPLLRTALCMGIWSPAYVPACLQWWMPAGPPTAPAC